MLRVLTWCAKCLFLYILVVALAIKLAWIFVLPVWAIATKLHWTAATRPVYMLSYFLPVFAATGFILGLVPFHRLGKALTELVPAAARFVEQDQVPAILWAWLPVSIAFLTRFLTWKSRNASVLGTTSVNTAGRAARFFGTLSQQTPALFDSKWAQDRFLFTGPMLFLMACALAVFLRRSLTRKSPPTTEASFPRDNGDLPS
jgi:hypothetical protein